MAGSPMLTVATVSSSLLVGGLLTLLGGLSRAARDHLRLTETQGWWLTACFTSALMFGLLISGVVIDRWSLVDVLVLGSLLGGFGIANLGLSRGLNWALFSAAALGIAGGLLHTASAVAMPATFSSPEQFATRAPAATNLGYVFVVLGGLLTPFLSRFLVTKLHFRNGLLILALLPVVSAVAILFSRADFPEAAQVTDLSLLLGNVRLWLAALAVFFFYAVENATVQWAPRYLSEVGCSERTRAILIVGFWCAFLAARLLSTSLEGFLAFTWLVLIVTILAAVIVGNMIGLHYRLASATSFLSLGACLGPIFPTLVGLIFLTFHPEDNYQHAVAFGLICALGISGRLVAEPLARQQLERDRVRLVMGVSMVLALIVAIPAMVFLVLGS